MDKKVLVHYSNVYYHLSLTPAFQHHYFIDMFLFLHDKYQCYTAEINIAPYTFYMQNKQKTHFCELKCAFF